MSQNPIFKGFPWSQAFLLPDDTLQAGDSVFAEFRYDTVDQNALFRIESGSGVEIDDQRVIMRLSAAQTAPLRNGFVVTNMVIERGGQNIPIGVIIRIPVTVLPTRP